MKKNKINWLNFMFHSVACNPVKINVIYRNTIKKHDAEGFIYYFS